MSTFWGYVGADIFAIVTISSASIICLICAKKFVTDYSQ